MRRILSGNWRDPRLVPHDCVQAASRTGAAARRPVVSSWWIDGRGVSGVQMTDGAGFSARPAVFAAGRWSECDWLVHNIPRLSSLADD